jgi:hypothetical protein
LALKLLTAASEAGSVPTEALVRGQGERPAPPTGEAARQAEACQNVLGLTCNALARMIAEKLGWPEL